MLLSKSLHPSPVIQAGASLKRGPRAVLRGREQPSPVIQAGASLKHMGEGRLLRVYGDPSPVIQAGASLKLDLHRSPRTSTLPFPGHPGRGLIEARRWERRTWSVSSPFPGHPGRGLIEAASATSPTSPAAGTFPGHPGRGLIEAAAPRPLPRLNSRLPRSSRPGPH